MPCYQRTGTSKSMCRFSYDTLRAFVVLPTHRYVEFRLASVCMVDRKWEYDAKEKCWKKVRKRARREKLEESPGSLWS